MPKCTSQAETTSNSEKIRPVALTVGQIRLSESTMYAVSQSVKVMLNQKKINYKEFVATLYTLWAYLTNTTKYCYASFGVMFLAKKPEAYS